MLVLVGYVYLMVAFVFFLLLNITDRYGGNNWPLPPEPHYLQNFVAAGLWPLAIAFYLLSKDYD